MTHYTECFIISRDAIVKLTDMQVDDMNRWKRLNLEHFVYRIQIDMKLITSSLIILGREILIDTNG